MINSYSNVSVIIPSNHSHKDLFKVVKAVNDQIIKPAELVIIDSSLENGKCPVEISELCAASGIKLIYEARTSAFPGYARNIGISRASSVLIAFLDVETIPRPDWLDNNLRILCLEGVLGAWGSTYFSAETKFERLVRDGLFGTHPRKTLPGSVFKREVFERLGKFVDWVRAGEDTEWMLRVEVHKLRVIKKATSSVTYTGLIGSNTKQLMKKWKLMIIATHHLQKRKVILLVGISN